MGLCRVDVEFGGVDTGFGGLQDLEVWGLGLET